MRAIAVCMGLVACVATAPPVMAGDIDLGLQEVLGVARDDQTVSALVFLNAQVDLDQLDATLKVARAPAQLRHEFVVRSLQTTAELSRSGMEEYLQRLQESGQIESYQSFWIVNAFRVDATPALIKQIAAHPDVRTVYYNYQIETIEPIDAAPVRSDSDGPRTPEIGLQVIHVPEVWALGYDGEGVLVSTLDTGVDGSHPALHDRWRGLDPNYAGHPQWAFFDPVTHWTTPQDSGAHGTHTMGTVCGGAPGDQIGVAPGAQWIHAAVIDRVSLTQTCTDSILAFQWLIDPDGDPSTSWDVPQTNSNSWGIATYHSIPPWSTPCDSSFWSYLDACETAGIVVLFSAGNEGPTPNSHRRPGDRATDDYRSCSVGAVDAHTASLPIAGFSSRGPTNCTPNGSAFIKPNISAPGVAVRSSFPGGIYHELDGTSMASPHINGVCALMKQACPDLTPNEIKQAIYDTAMDKGTPGKDNDYGWGVVDALAAVNRAIGLCVSSEGKIKVDRSVYMCDDVAVTTVRDLDLNLDPSVLDTVQITVSSTTDPVGVTVMLTETDPNSAKFVGPATLSATGGPGVLQVFHGDTLTATYIDADNGLGGHNIPVLATASIDCVPPAIVAVQATNIAVHSATISFQTDEQAIGSVHYGFSCEALDHTAAATSFATTTTINLTELVDDSVYYFKVEAHDQAGNVGADPNCYTFTTPVIPDYFTELFDTGAFDLAHDMLTFLPDGGPDFYTACVTTQISSLPTDPTGGTVLTFTNNDNGNTQVSLTGGAHVLFYGSAYTSFYVGTNGYLTFGSGDTTSGPSIGSHFSKLRIAPLFDDLIVAGDAQIICQQLSDHVAVTWSNIPRVGPTGSNTFQIELFYDGQITISYLDVSDTNPLVGLSRGQGQPSDFYESNLSAEGLCGPRPPRAHDTNYEVPTFAPASLLLQATDEGLPDPPGALTFTIKSLPARGRLSDPGASSITAVPYTLVNSGNQVIYKSLPYYTGPDTFHFAATDGGTPPEGGESNVAPALISVGEPAPVYTWNLDTNPGWAAQYRWNWAVPTGHGGDHGGPDPTSGYTGSHVYGYNIYGGYTNNLLEYHLTTNEINCSALTRVRLRFWRWLGVEGSAQDHAYVRVSTDRVHWTKIWENPITVIDDQAWTLQQYDISALADGQSAVSIRWTMGTTNDSVTYCGWNIDDIQILGVAPSPILVGDTNCDDVTDFGDVDPFVLAMSDPAQYAAEYPDCYILSADCNGDGVVTFDDVNAFLDLLSAGG